MLRVNNEPDILVISSSFDMTDDQGHNQGRNFFLKFQICYAVYLIYC